MHSRDCNVISLSRNTLLGEKCHGRSRLWSRWSTTPTLLGNRHSAGVLLTASFTMHQIQSRHYFPPVQIASSMWLRKFSHVVAVLVGRCVVIWQRYVTKKSASCPWSLKNEWKITNATGLPVWWNFRVTLPSVARNNISGYVGKHVPYT